MDRYRHLRTGQHAPTRDVLSLQTAHAEPAAVAIAQAETVQRSRRATFCAAALAAALVLLWLLFGPGIHQAAAVPHTISNVPHPYDDDWPDVYLLLATKCMSCHRAGTDQVDLSSYEALMQAKSWNNRPLVVAGDPEASPLWEQVAWNVKAEDDSPHPAEPLMPPDHLEWLTAGQLEIIHRWISHGALEYKLPGNCNHKRPLLEIDFPSAKECKACHPKQYDEWSRSMHHYAQHSPVFEAFNQALIERTNGTVGTFCTRCHTPLGTALGENGSRRNIHRSRLSMEGVTCVVCHRVPQGRPYYKSNVRMATQPGGTLTTCVFGPFNDPVQTQSQSHPAAGAKYIKTAEFCGGCHDVTNPEGIRLEEAFSEWQNSPAAKHDITCQQCHMGPVQGQPFADHQRPLGRAAIVPGVDPASLPLRHLTDHTFAGPDYSLLPDTEFPEKLDWMYEVDYRCTENLTPYQRRTLDQLRRENRRQLRIADQKRYELLTNAAEIKVDAPRFATCGEKLPVQVDVFNKVAGHNLPTGFTAERQVWVSVTLLDPHGRVVFASGDLDPNGDLRDEHSHAVLTGELKVDKHLLNFQSRFTVLANRGTERTVVLSVNRDLTPINILRPAVEISASFGRHAGFRVAKGSLAPLSSQGQVYPIHLPALPGDYLLDVKLNYRHLPPSLLDHVGTPHLKHLLEVVVIDHYQAAISVSAKPQVVNLRALLPFE